MKVFTKSEFINKLYWLVNDVPNVYHSENGTWDTFYNGKWRMDCVVSIKGLLWGFRADKSKTHGGGVYLSNGVADFSANEGINYCSDVSTNFNHIEVGEYLCMKGTKYSHCGIYLGNGKVFECTTGWNARKCIISNIDRNGGRSLNGIPNLTWTYHGKLRYIDYGEDGYTERVKTLQRTLNEQYHLGLDVDGSFGPLTYRACMNNYLYLGKKAPIHIKWLQQRLIDLGYSVGKYGIDGSFGYDTLKAVKEFQRNNGLVVDGYVGGDTHKKLVSR